MNTAIWCKSVICVGLLTCAFPTRATNPNPLEQGIDYPIKRDSEAYGRPNSCYGHKYDDHEYARACYVISDDGTVHVWSKFTNNRPIDGDHLAAIYVFSDEKGRTIFTTTHLAGINGQYFTSKHDRYVHTHGQIEATDVPRIAHVHIEWHNVNTVNDEEIARQLTQIAAQYLTHGLSLPQDQ